MLTAVTSHVSPFTSMGAATAAPRSCVASRTALVDSAPAVENYLVYIDVFNGMVWIPIKDYVADITIFSLLDGP